MKTKLKRAIFASLTTGAIIGTLIYAIKPPKSKDAETTSVSSLYINKESVSEWAKDAGLSNKIPNVAYLDSLKRFYNQNFGLKFHSIREVDAMLTPGTVLRPAEDFKPEISTPTLKELQANYLKIRGEIIFCEIIKATPIPLCRNDFKNIPDLTGELSFVDVETESIEPKAIKKYGIENESSFIVSTRSAFRQYGKIMLIAPVQAFVAPRPIDPIALVEVHDGWIELARW